LNKEGLSDSDVCIISPIPFTNSISKTIYAARILWVRPVACVPVAIRPANEISDTEGKLVRQNPSFLRTSFIVSKVAPP
jgi:hypothetical protein